MADALNHEPSLANRVGKHWAHVSSLYLAYAAAVGEENWPAIHFLLARDLAAMAGPNVESNDRRVLVFPVMRPEPDVEKPARAFMTLAEQIQHEKEGADEAA